MINFRDKEELPTTIVSLVSIIALVGILLFMIFVPMPSVDGLDAKHRKERFQAQLDADKARDRVNQSRAVVANRTWNVPLEQVGPAAHSRVAAFAKQRKVTLKSFRPLREAETTDLTQAPYMITAEGSYPAIVGLLQDIETPGSRLAVNLVQIASADGGSDLVTASIGVVAYRPVSTKEAVARG